MSQADDALLADLERQTFCYFERETNPVNGLVSDNSRPGAPASIAGSGLALGCFAVAAERGFLPRAEAVERVRTTLRFFWSAEQSEKPDATGYRGFFYHFLDMQTGRRVWECEISTIDSSLVFIGALTAAAYFDRDTPEEREIRELAEALYGRADWEWATNGGQAVSLGWRPEGGFIRYGWDGYNEALFLYVLALGSPTHPLPPESYAAWSSTYRWKRVYGHEYLYAGPLFIHQLSHAWIDFRGIQDPYMRAKSIDYFENSRRATYVQREYAKRNPRGWAGYGENAWGVSASDGPGPATCPVNGERRRFWGYHARGVPFGPDDGTLSPWATLTSLPFAPEIVLPALRHFQDAYPELTNGYGYKCSFNPSFCEARHSDTGWVSEGHYAIDQGPVVLMIENYRSALVWRLLRRSPYVVRGLLRAGFSGGWLPSPDST